MKFFVVEFFRVLTRFHFSLGIRIANSLRIRKWSGWVFDCMVETEYYGVRLKVNCHEWHGFYIHIGQCYERSVLNWIRQNAYRYPVFFDVGGNIGLHSLVFALSNPSAKVTTFEPVPNLAAQVKTHVFLNQMADRIRMIQTAVADRSGEQTFDLGEDSRNLGVGSLVFKSDKAKHTMTVKTASLSDLLEQDSIWPDLIKIDVEGAELLVLEGMDRALGNGSPLPDILMEVHSWMFPSEKNHSQKIFQWLSKYRYTVWAMNEDNGALEKVDDDSSLLGRSMILATSDSNRFNA